MHGGGNAASGKCLGSFCDFNQRTVVPTDQFVSCKSHCRIFFFFFFYFLVNRRPAISGYLYNFTPTPSKYNNEQVFLPGSFFF